MHIDKSFLSEKFQKGVNYRIIFISNKQFRSHISTSTSTVKSNWSTISQRTYNGTNQWVRVKQHIFLTGIIYDANHMWYSI